MHFAITALFALIAAIWLIQSLRAFWGMTRVPWLAHMPPISGDAVPSISIIFAARDEAEKIAGALTTLLGQDYPRYEVIAVNDRSQDSTGAILRQFARASNRLKVLDVDELPQGWLGKPHALHLAAEQATGEWLIFTDADVHFAPDVLRRSLNLALSRGWDHLSLLSGFDMRGFWETTMLTFFTIGFVIGNEPWRASNPRSGRYVGVGAFQLLRRRVYDAVGGHRVLAMEVVEDMKLGKLIKLGGFRSGLGIGAELVHLRWYSSMGNIVRGLTKNMFAALDFSLTRAFGSVILTLIMSVLPFLGIFFAHGWARVFAGVAVGMALIFHCGISVHAKVSPLYGLTHPIGASIFAWIIARSTIVTLAQRGIVWRGTFYPIEELRRGSV